MHSPRDRGRALAVRAPRATGRPEAGAAARGGWPAGPFAARACWPPSRVGAAVTRRSLKREVPWLPMKRPSAGAVWRSAGGARPGRRDPPGGGRGRAQADHPAGTRGLGQDQTPCGRASAARTCSRTSASGRRFSGFDHRADTRAGWCTPAGYGAHGYFENYEPLTEIKPRADPFCEALRTRRSTVRFSTVAGNKGSSDLARDVRGFATKFYTREGNWVLRRDQHAGLLHPGRHEVPGPYPQRPRAEPDRGFPQPQTAHDNFWDFASLMPESGCTC